MKYAGSITIIDDEGNTVFERELDEDEIVEAILAAVPDGSEAESEEVEEVEPLPAPIATPRLSKGPGIGKPCCGSLGKRHKKDCGEQNPEAVQRRRTVDGRHPFSEPTYKVVKTLLEDEDNTVDGISIDKGLDNAEVRRVALADDFDDYLAIA